MLVSDPSQVTAFDAVFFAVFGGRERDEPFEPDDVQTVVMPADERPAVEHTTSSGDDAQRDARGSVSTAPAGIDDDPGAEVDVPLAMASDEERLQEQELRRGSNRTSWPSCTASCRVCNSRRRCAARAGTSGAATASRSTCAARCAAVCAPAATRSGSRQRHRRFVPRRLVVLATSPVRSSRTPAPTCRSHLRRGSGPNAEAFVFATRLTHLTRALFREAAERAVQRAASAAPDWSSARASAMR